MQYAADGEAYFGAGNGLGNLDSTAPQSREFASGRLKLCLEAGRRYQLSFSVCAPTNLIQAWRGYDCFEVYFHSNEFPLDGQNLGVTNRFYEVASKAIRMPVNGPVVERGIWHKLEVTFTAQGNECYFTVGCFKWLRPENIGVLVGPGVNAPVANGIYYLYDDFVLTEIPDDTTPEPTPEPVVPNVLTPNGDGINDFWVVENLPPGTAVAIYNRW
ncbi:MAG: gliding motility-associated C-terminal domain-containing protein, partial [Sphingobacteriaceae bacterium]|nr:gliding motility-associated C-terminal domain-containing protein [Sphingobacteriaceae bacterium]